MLTQENKETTGSDTNKTIQPELPPFNLKRKFDEANKEEASPTLENKEIAGSSTTKKIKLDLPLLNLRRIPNEVVQTPENEEVAGSSTNRKRKLDLHPSNLKQKLDEPSNEEVIPIPENEEVRSIRLQSLSLYACMLLCICLCINKLTISFRNQLLVRQSQDGLGQKVDRSGIRAR